MSINWIQVEKEVHTMLYGGPNMKPQGHWVILRWFRIGMYSKYWDSKRKESIAGPKWKYYDYPLRVTYSIGGLNQPASGSLKLGLTTIPGTVEADSRLYIVERCYNPKVGDYILEYDCDYPDTPSEFVEFAKVTRSVKHRIVNVEAIRTDGSKIIYYLVKTILDQESR